MSKPLTRLEICPHCGNKAPQRLVLMQLTESSTLDSDWNELPAPAAWYIAICEACSNVLVYCGWAEGCIPEEDHFLHHLTILMWPKSEALHPAVPKPIVAIYKEAHRIKEIAPNAFAVQIRRALEAVCDDQGVSKGTLYKRIVDLVNKGIVPTVFGEAADLLRAVGNMGAHAGDVQVHPWLVSAVDDLFLAVVEYVYIAPKKVEDFRQRLDDYRRKVKKAHTI